MKRAKPDKCALNPTELAMRVADWREVSSLANSTTIEESRIISTYSPDRKVAQRLRHLIAAEEECCTFLNFSIREEEAQTVVEVAFPPEAGAAVRQVLISPTTTVTLRGAPFSSDLPTPTPYGAMRLLIVDDDEQMRRLVRRCVEKGTAFAIVGEASNGRAALEMMGNVDVGVVLSDVSMPEMDGLQLTREVKKRYPSVHVLLLTSQTDNRTQEEARAAGASGFLSKAEIGKKITRALEVAEALGPDRRRSDRSRAIESIWLRNQTGSL